MEKLYNKGVFWSDKINEAVENKLNQKFLIFPTFHMQVKAHKLNISENCSKASLFGEVVEALFENDVLVKVITRLPNKFNKDEDLCFAVAFVDDCDECFAQVRTVWINRHSDNHSTIHTENYATN